LRQYRQNDLFGYGFPCQEIVGQVIPPDLREYVLRIMQAHGGNAIWTETNTIFTFPEGTTATQMGYVTTEARYRIVFPDRYEAYEICSDERRGNFVAFQEHEFPAELVKKYAKRC
jgi:hypothetical protein